MANAIVGQSGGPTSVINASLAGVFQACQHRGAEHVYGMLHGIQGLLNEKVCDLTQRLSSNIDIELLSSGIYEAMVTTVGGLIVGIIAYFFHAILSTKIQKVVNLLEAKATEFMDVLNEPA